MITDAERLAVLREATYWETGDDDIDGWGTEDQISPDAVIAKTRGADFRFDGKQLIPSDDASMKIWMQAFDDMLDFLGMGNARGYNKYLDGYGAEWMKDLFRDASRIGINHNVLTRFMIDLTPSLRHAIQTL